MTPEQLNAIKERAAMATPDPWRTPMRTIYSNDGYVANTSRIVDAEFIAAAREDIPALVAEVERLLKAVEKLTEEKSELAQRLDIIRMYGTNG